MSSITFSPGQNGNVDIVTMPYDSERELKDPNWSFKRWIGDNTSPETQYIMLRTIASRETDNVLRNSELTNRWYFSTGLIYCFHHHIERVLWENYFGRWMVDMGHSLDQSPFLPYVHILRTQDVASAEAQFRTLVAWLLSDDAMTQYRKNEAPQNYNIPALEVLWKQKIQPLEILPDTAILSGDDMRNVANFLMPVSVKRNDHSNFID